MIDTFTLHLNSTLTEEDWNKIRDAELESTERIWYSTPNGRKVNFINANVLDKIREEIVDKSESGQYSEAVRYGFFRAILIIDKYRWKAAETDEEDDDDKEATAADASL